MAFNETVRCWVHKDLINVLKELNEIINEVSIKSTSYPIDTTLPISSKIASKMLKNIIKNNKELITIDKIDKTNIFNSKISDEIKGPIYFIKFGNKNDEIIAGDKQYLNAKFQKKIGIKKNEIYFL